METCLGPFLTTIRETIVARPCLFRICAEEASLVTFFSLSSSCPSKLTFLKFRIVSTRPGPPVGSVLVGDGGGRAGGAALISKDFRFSVCGDRITAPSGVCSSAFCLLPAPPSFPRVRSDAWKVCMSLVGSVGIHQSTHVIGTAVSGFQSLSLSSFSTKRKR